MGLKLDRLVQGIVVVAATMYGGPAAAGSTAGTFSAGAGLAAAVATESVIQGRRGADLQQAQQEEQRNLAKLNRQKAIRKQVQEQQFLMAQNEVAGQVTGTTGSSGQIGSQQNLTSSAGSNILNITQVGQVEDRISGMSNEITRRRSRASTAQSLFQIGSSPFGQRLGTKISTIFDQ